MMGKKQKIVLEIRTDAGTRKNKKKGKGKKGNAGQVAPADQQPAAGLQVVKAPGDFKAAIREQQGKLKQKYKVRADSALITSAVQSVTDEGGDPRRVRIAVDGPAGTVFDIGAHPSVGGDEDLPCSGDVFLASLAACQEITIRLVASALGLPLHHLHVRVEGDWDVRGTLGVDRNAPIGFTALRVQVDLDTTGAADRIERLLESARKYCVVGQTLDHVPPVTFHPNVTNRGVPANVDVHAGQSAAD